MAAIIAPTGKEKLEPRLFAALQNANAKDDTLDKLGDADVVSVILFANLADDRESFRKIMEKPEIGVKSGTLAGSLEQAKLVAVWNSLRTTVEVEDKANAERMQLALPPTISMKDLQAQKKIFEPSVEGFPVSKVVCPSKADFERKIAEVERGF